MNESILYNICMLVSTMVEVYLVFDFYKAFHAKTEIFRSRVWELGLGLSILQNIVKKHNGALMISNALHDELQYISFTLLL